ncbi:MAG: hypothetical protein IJI44_01300 [Erysipelotrichaceae bacterium]|nr:hypothetical protein [Erysipelotrichaceae bacterium]
MKKILICDYWTMIFAWCMFLNGYGLFATAIGFLAGIILLLVKSEADPWRVIAVGVLSFCPILLALNSTKIPFYFSGSYFFLAAVCFNTAVVNEYLYLFRVRLIRAVLIVLLVSMIILTSLIAILPSRLYTLFGKTNLYLMDTFIFLPYLIPTACCVIYKTCLFQMNINRQKKSLLQ